MPTNSVHHTQYILTGEYLKAWISYPNLLDVTRQIVWENNCNSGEWMANYLAKAFANFPFANDNLEFRIQK